MLDFYTARQQLLDTHECGLEHECVKIHDAANRVLAQPLLAAYPNPLFDNSAMDGYAVCDPEGSLRQFNIVGRVQAGDGDSIALQTGEAVRIFTGAPIPANTTAVVPQEQTHVSDGVLAVTAEIRLGQHIRRQAEEINVGDCLLEQGHRLDTAALGLAASQGFDQVVVYKRLKAIVFSSGNELVEPGMPLSDGQIYDANRYQLMAWLQACGVDVSDGKILPDDLAHTEQALRDGAEQFDVVITSGGASVGEADYLKTAIENIGILATHTLAIKPGKPFAWGNIAAAKVFILPGNPVAAFVTIQMLLLPVLNKLTGKGECYWHLPVLTATADFSTHKSIKRREFLRVGLRLGTHGETQAVLLPNQGSAMLATCVQADALCEVPPGEVVAAGENVTLHLLPK